VQISLSDVGEDYVFTIHDGSFPNVEKKTVSDPDVTVTVANTLMDGIMSKTSNPILAYFTGKLKIKGTRDDLLRLQRLMG
jgi:putative sterol carrier protein